MQNWFVICGIFLLWSTELHINKYFGVNLKLLDLPFAHGFIKFPKQSKEQKKLNIEATSKKVSKFCRQKILFGFLEGFFANFKGSEAVN